MITLAVSVFAGLMCTPMARRELCPQCAESQWWGPVTPCRRLQSLPAWQMASLSTQKTWPSTRQWLDVSVSCLCMPSRLLYGTCCRLLSSTDFVLFCLSSWIFYLLTMTSIDTLVFELQNQIFLFLSFFKCFLFTLRWNSIIFFCHLKYRVSFES